MNTKKASDLPPRLLRRMLADTERTAGPDSQSAAALRRALVEAKRRAAKRPVKEPAGDAGVAGTSGRPVRGPA